MKMPGRYGNDGDKYKYGFNGMESDDEMYSQEGNSYDFGARMLDVRTGRWNARDNHPKAFQSDYAFAKGNPIIFVDPDGNDDYFYAQGLLVQVISTGSAPRFFSINAEIVNLTPTDVTLAMSGVSQPKQFYPSASYIAYMHFNSFKTTQHIQDDYTRNYDSKTRNDISDARGAMVSARAHSKFSGLAKGLAILLAAPAVMENFGVFIVEQVTQTVLEEASGIPLPSVDDLVKKRVARGLVKKGGEKIIRNYKSVSLKKTIDDFTPGSKGVMNKKGTKTIYKNGETGSQVIVDNKSGNFRIKDSEGYHVSPQGERVNAPSGMTGQEASDYVQENTHFTNSDTK